MECLKLRCVNKCLTAAQWQLLGWALLDIDPNNRQQLLSQFGEIIQRTPVHPRFLAYPCLLANDEALLPIAEKYLVFAVKRLRCTHEELCTKAMTTDDADEIERLQMLAQAHMPESILPYVLYLLSHHPNFPQSATMEEVEDQDRLRAVIQSVRLVVSSLLDSLPGGCNTGNLSLIFKQVNLISQYYKDRLDEDNLGLHFVSQVTTKVLKSRIQTVDNVQSYPGDVHLPMDLYAAYDNSALSQNQKAIKTAVLLEAEGAIDKVLGLSSSGVSGGQANRRKHAPKKPTVPAAVLKTNQAADNRGQKRRGGQEETQKSKGKKTKTAPAPPERVSSRPQRAAAKGASYTEQNENDAETARWEALAAENSDHRRRSFNRLRA